MPSELTRALAEMGIQTTDQSEPRIYGVTLAEVVDNCDLTGQGRVRVRLPWLPGLEPWARLALMDAGAYFIPQIRDEVLVASNHGDIRDLYVVGCLWNATDRPPAGAAPTDAIHKRLIRTRRGHEIEFDDARETITITTITQQKITMDAQKVEIASGGEKPKASISLDTAGNVTIKGVKIKLDAPSITVEGENLSIHGTASTRINGGAACDIKAALVTINEPG